jgi:hypothetical protein
MPFTQALEMRVHIVSPDAEKDQPFSTLPILDKVLADAAHYEWMQYAIMVSNCELYN